MKIFAKVLLLGGLMVASAPFALADKISVGGKDTIDTTNQTITLVPNSGTVGVATGIFSPYTDNFTYLPGPFSYTVGSTLTFPAVQIAYMGPLATPTLRFYVTSETATFDGTSLGISGNGYFVLADGTIVNATYILNTDNSGLTTLQATATTTPEPSSLVLLGTGLLGAAGFVFRKRSLV